MSSFQIIDAEQCLLKELSLTSITSHIGTVIRNVKPFTIEEYKEFSCQFGYPLCYGAEILVSFYEIYNENEFHYDGISSNDPAKVPAWLSFYVEECQDPNIQGGEFMLMDCVSAFEALSPEIKNILRTSKQEFYGYQLYGKPPTSLLDLSFSIDPVMVIDGHETLRMHIPSGLSTRLYSDNEDLVHSNAHNLCFKFKGLSGTESLDIFNQIRSTVMNGDHLMVIPFQSGDILIANNNRVFHGRNRVDQPLPRKFHRIQLLDNPYFDG